MKVSFFDSDLQRDFARIFTIISTVVSLIFIFVNLDSKVCKFIFSGILIVLFIILYIVLWILANKKEKLSLDINENKVNIFIGDIFAEQGFKVIPFNEYFDTQVDDKVISKSSLNGQYLQKKISTISTLDKRIEEQLATSFFETNKGRNPKEKKYKLGTVFINDDYLLLAFSKFDKDNCAFLNMEDYFHCMFNFWNEVDRVYAGKTIVVPLLGSGITRFKGNEKISYQNLLILLLTTFQQSKLAFPASSSLNIVLNKEIVKNIDLYSIKHRFA